MQPDESPGTLDEVSVGVDEAVSINFPPWWGARR
jgi:hypothetical protein